MVDGSNKCYVLAEDDEVNTWNEAMDYCDSKMSYDYSVDYNTDNTKLATIDSDDENDQLFQQMYDNDVQSAWIGLSWNGKYVKWYITVTRDTEIYFKNRNAQQYTLLFYIF